MSDLTKPWHKWYIQALLKKNPIMDVSLKTQVDRELVFKNIDDWNIYLVKDHNSGIFRTSNIVEFNNEEMTVKTKRGSIYQLGQPLNDNQVQNLESYFNNE